MIKFDVCIKYTGRQDVSITLVNLDNHNKRLLPPTKCTKEFSSTLYLAWRFHYARRFHYFFLLFILQPQQWDSALHVNKLFSKTSTILLAASPCHNDTSWCRKWNEHSSFCWVSHMLLKYGANCSLTHSTRLWQFIIRMLASTQDTERIISNRFAGYSVRCEREFSKQLLMMEEPCSIKQGSTCSTRAGVHSSSSSCRRPTGMHFFAVNQ